MKTKIIALLLLTAFATPADARRHRTKKRSTKAVTRMDGSSSMIKMHRSACFGRCPIYEVLVYGNGLVEYRGIRFTQYAGIYQKNIGTVAAADLLKRFADQRIDTCKELYDKAIPDLPGLSYEYKLNGKSGQVNNADSGPMWLKVMSTRVDELAKVDSSWKKVSDTASE